MDSLVEWAKTFWGLWLMLIFLGIVAYVFWPGRKREMEEHGRIPFDDPADDLEKKDGRQD